MNKETTKVKTWTYPIAAYFTSNNIEYCYVTQLYQIGVYIIFNSDPNSQGSIKPSQVVTIKNRLIKDRDSGKVTNLVFGREIKVTKDSDGFYVEVKD